MKTIITIGETNNQVEVESNQIDKLIVLTDKRLLELEKEFDLPEDQDITCEFIFDEETIVTGDSNFLKDNQYHVEWECPITGETKWAQGCFQKDNTTGYDYLIHEVTDEELILLYTVLAQK